MLLHLTFHPGYSGAQAHFALESTLLNSAAETSSKVTVTSRTHLTKCESLSFSLLTPTTTTTTTTCLPCSYATSPPPTQPGYAYTAANKNAGITWTEDVLFAYLGKNHKQTFAFNGSHGIWSPFKGRGVVRVIQGSREKGEKKEGTCFTSFVCFTKNV